MDKKYYVVDYDYMTGEYGISKQKLVEGEPFEDFHKILDRYFDGFFDDKTYKSDTLTWVAGNDEQCIKVRNWVQVPKKHAQVLKKYMK